MRAIWSTSLQSRQASSGELPLVRLDSEQPSVPNVAPVTVYSWTDQKQQVKKLDVCFIFSKRLISACEWHLNDKYNKASKKAKKFHKYFQKQNKGGCLAKQTIKDRISSIEKGYLDDMPKTNDWNKIRKLFNQAKERNDSYQVIRAYTCYKMFSTRLNMDLARSTYHELQLYCTSLNCNVLARTQDSMRAIVSIMFHEQFDDYVFSEGNLYRGVILRGEERKLIVNYKKDKTIITTTFLSTSTNENVANAFSDGDPHETDALSISCRYKLMNTRRRTALRINTLSCHLAESEILILPYVPFRIIELTKSDDGKKMDIWFEELEDY